ncbi:MAG: hypothetical protein ACTSX7_02800 [Alphaproteobacteria bacterium]
MKNVPMAIFIAPASTSKGSSSPKRANVRHVDVIRHVDVKYPDADKPKRTYANEPKRYHTGENRICCP